MKKGIILGLMLLLCFGGYFFYTKTQSKSFENVLSSALQKYGNTQENFQEEVIFMREDFLTYENNSSQKNDFPKISSGENTDISLENSGENLQDQTQEIKKLGDAFLEDNSSANSDISNIDTSLGGYLNNSNTTNGNIYNDNCAGIFFDPCLVVSPGEDTYGDMRLGTTPIYDSVEKMQNVYGS